MKALCKNVKGEGLGTPEPSPVFCPKKEITMTRQEAQAEFCQTIRPSILKQHGRNDRPAMRQAWVIFLDDLHRNDRITDDQVNNW